jgi:hypothetical protein
MPAEALNEHLLSLQSTGVASRDRCEALILSDVNNSAGPDTPGPTVSRIAHLRDGAIGISEGAFGDQPGQQPQHLVADLLRQALPQTARHR